MGLSYTRWNFIAFSKTTRLWGLIGLPSMIESYIREVIPACHPMLTI